MAKSTLPSELSSRAEPTGGSVRTTQAGAERRFLPVPGMSIHQIHMDRFSAHVRAQSVAIYLLILVRSNMEQVENLDQLHGEKSTVGVIKGDAVVGENCRNESRKEMRRTVPPGGRLSLVQ
ncbi:hypothetical protein BJV77DRAFT_1153053 [Russula vinacea]|nr:hypothetical protein BJV77DRAFT_1153053 [Russula vinacea]